MKTSKPQMLFAISSLQMMLCSGLHALAENPAIIVDLTRERTIESLRPRELGFVELNGFGSIMRSFHSSHREITWIFPDETRVTQRATLANMDFYSDGSLLVYSIGEMMPLDELIKTVRKLHHSLDESSAKFDLWASTEGIKGLAGEKFLWRNSNSNPEISYEITRSYGHYFPWMLVFNANWLSPKQLQKPSKLPFKRKEVISLNPPSGQRYTAEEDSRLYLEHAPITTLIDGAKSNHIERRNSPENKFSENLATPEKTTKSTTLIPFSAWFWIGVIVVEIILIGCFYCRKPARQNNH
jgi:hypothetical protein